MYGKNHTKKTVPKKSYQNHIEQILPKKIADESGGVKTLQKKTQKGLLFVEPIVDREQFCLRYNDRRTFV